jgi:hypothetical protein
MGRAGATFSSSSAMAFASKMPDPDRQRALVLLVAQDDDRHVRELIRA